MLVKYIAQDVEKPKYEGVVDINERSSEELIKAVEKLKRLLGNFISNEISISLAKKIETDIDIKRIEFE